jgi:hypothetical protein
MDSALRAQRNLFPSSFVSFVFFVVERISDETIFSRGA